MYGTLAFSRDGKSPSAEFRAVQSVQGKCYRQAACDRCRISRAKCSGRLHDSDCERCARLGKLCSYTTSQKTRRSRQSSKSTEDSTTLVEPPSPRNSGRREGEGGKLPGLTYLASPDPSTTTGDHLGINHLGTGDLPNALDSTWWHFDDDPHMITSSWPESSGTDLPNFLAIADSQYFSKFLSAECQVDYMAHTLVSPLPLEIKERNIGTKDTAKKITSEPATGGPGDIVVPGPPKSAEGCRCLPELSSCLFALDSCKGSQPSLSLSQTDVIVNPLEIDDFLDVFKHSMMRLRVVESCHFACFISREFAVLLLMSVEQLTKLLLDLAARTPGYRQSVSNQTPDNPSALTASARRASCDNSRHGSQESRDSSIGKFKLRDPLDLQVIIEQLLRIRVRDLQSFVAAIGDKMNYYGLNDLGARFTGIHEEIGKIFIQVKPRN